MTQCVWGLSHLLFMTQPYRQELPLNNPEPGFRKANGSEGHVARICNWGLNLHFPSLKPGSWAPCCSELSSPFKFEAVWSSFCFSKARSEAILSSPSWILMIVLATYLLAGLSEGAACGWYSLLTCWGHCLGLTFWVWVPRPKEGRVLECLRQNPLYCWLTAVHHGSAPQGSLGSLCWFHTVLKCGSLWSQSSLHMREVT